MTTTNCPHRRVRITLTLGHEVEKHCEDCGAELDVTSEDEVLATGIDVIVETWTLKDEYEQDDAAVVRIAQTARRSA